MASNGLTSLLWFIAIIAMIPVAFIGLVLATRVWNARARPKSAVGH